MIRILKKLILKIVFSPLWLLTLFLPIIYLDNDEVEHKESAELILRIDEVLK